MPASEAGTGVVAPTCAGESLEWESRHMARGNDGLTDVANVAIQVLDSHDLQT